MRICRTHLHKSGSAEGLRPVEARAHVGSHVDPVCDCVSVCVIVCVTYICMCTNMCVCVYLCVRVYV